MFEIVQRRHALGRRNTLTSSSVPPFQVYGSISISHSARDQASKSTCRLLLSEGRFCNKKFEQLGSGCRGRDHICLPCNSVLVRTVFPNRTYLSFKPFSCHLSASAAGDNSSMFFLRLWKKRIQPWKGQHEGGSVGNSRFVQS